jgi:hypothetical protein
MNINAHSTEPIADADLLGDRLRLRGRLALLGWPSLQAWAVHHRFDPTAVHHALSKWAKPRTDGRRPHGKASTAIITSLRATLAEGRTFRAN